MRPPRVLGPTRLSILVLTLISYANSQTQERLLCKQPGTQNCFLWLFNLEGDRISTNGHITTNIPYNCGLTEKRFISSHGKFFKVRQIEKKTQLKKIFCNKVILVGRFFDWKEVENALDISTRVRRQSFTPRGRYRGQTQSQYLAIDRGNGKDEGRAEALSAADSSRASVSGNSGMGQAQSQSLYDPNCDDCYGKSNHEVENLKRPIGYKPGDIGYAPNSGSSWPTLAQNGGYNPTDGQRYVPGQNIPDELGLVQEPGLHGSNAKPGNRNVQSSGTEPNGPGTLGSNNYRPNGATGNGYYPYGNEGANFRPVPGNNGYLPNGSIDSRLPNRYDPNHGIDDRYRPNDGSGGFGPGRNPDYMGGNPQDLSGLGPNGANEKSNAPSIDSNGFRPSGSHAGGYIPNINAGTNRGPGVDNYNPNQGHRQGDIPTSPGNSVPQVGTYRPGQTPNQITQGESNNPKQVDSNFTPSVGNGVSGGTYPAVRTTGNPVGFGTGQSGTPNINWPIASGPYQVPGGNVYCCVIPNNGITGNMYPNNFEAVKGTPTIPYGTNMPEVSGGTNVPGGQYKPGGHYIPGTTGSTTVPGQFLLGNTGGPLAPGSQYGVNTYPSGQYIPTNTGNNIGIPGGQYVPGSTGDASVPRNQYGPGGTSVPGGQYSQGRSSGPSVPGGQYGPGGSIGSTVPGGQYGPGGNSGPSVPGGQYGPGGSSGSTLPGGQYGPGGSGDSTVPGGRYGPDGSSGPSIPGGQYGPGGSIGSTVPGGQYGPGGSIGPSVPRGQYGPDGSSGPSVPGGQYGPGGSSGPSVPGGQYGPGGSSGSTVPRGQYGPDGSSGPSVPGGQYGPGGSSGPSVPGGQYGPGGSSGSTVPRGQYGPGGSSGSTVPGQYGPGGSSDPSAPGGQYGPGGSSGSTVPGGQYGPGGSSGSTLPGGQYGPGGGSGSTMPGGQYGQGGGSGSTMPGSSYGPGGSGGSTMPGGQYGPGRSSGPSVPGGQYGPGRSSGSTVPGRQYGQGGSSGPSVPGGQYGQDGSSGPSVPGGQYGPGGSSISTVPGGQHGPGGGSGSTMPGGQYGPGGGSGSTMPGSSYGPGGSGGSTVPGGQYGPGGGTGTSVPGGQYGPGGSSGSTVPGGQYRPGGGSGTTVPGGQYGPGGSSGSTVPGGQYGPGGGSGSTVPGGQYGPIGESSNTMPGGQYGPSGSRGSSVPGGQYIPTDTRGTGQYIPGNQYVPGATGNAGNTLIPGGHYATGGTVSPGGQYGKGNAYPGSGMNQSKTPQGFYNQGVPTGPNTDYNGVPQNYLDPNTVAADGDDSEAEANVAQNINGTTASASSKGGNDKGRAQTSVQGTYTGSGSFQAQAQITGENKEAQSEVSGGKKGASSSASGSGKNNKSQANVQLGSETGSVQTQSQSNGVMHSSNSQVQGSVKGGMADAQARGPGSTSSQAQIGFTPYKDEDKSRHDLQRIPFTGGGMASAQSSGRTGQSQSQLHGTFKYGITYNGAAQSGASLDKDAVFPNRLPFEKIDVFDEKEKNINVDKINMDITETPQSLDYEPPILGSSTLSESSSIKENVEMPTTENVIDESMKNSESRYASHPHTDHHTPDSDNTTYSNGPTLLGSRRSFKTNYGSMPDYEFTTDKDETQPEYDTDVGYEGDGNEASDVEQNEYSNYDEYSRDSPTHQYLQNTNRKGLEVQQTTGGNTQHIILGALKDQNAEIIQRDTERPDENRVYQPGERVPGTGGYTIPVGFTGSVKSVASKDKTYVVGSKDFPSQAQTVTLTPGKGKIKYTHPSTYGKYVKPKNLRSLQSSKENDNNRYVSVSKSVTRALDSDNNIRKQYSHTYYTKSSSCGYFTFTCTMVSSAEGRKKVCKPKMPTNPDGTPIRC